MKRLKQVWTEITSELENVYESREAKNMALILMEDAFGISKTDVTGDVHLEIDNEKLKNHLSRLLKHEPIQYVTGIADFYGRKFQINQSALIPRPETEELVDLIIRETKMDQPKILDVGVGSGCISITLALETQGEVYGTDISEESISLAIENAEAMRANVHFFHHNILTEDLLISGLDILVSNPPYIPLSEKKSIRRNVTEYEPHQALFAHNEDAILFHKRIGDQGKRTLKKGGRLYFEIHEDFAQETSDYLQQVGYSEIATRQDMQGKNRMIGAINGANK